MKFKQAVSAMLLTSAIGAVHADEVCKYMPGHITCGKGEVKKLIGNGSVTLNGTKITHKTQVNGTLNADDVTFNSLDVSGSATLTECKVLQETQIKGALKASSSVFEQPLTVHSTTTKLIDSKVNANLYIKHTDTPNQEVFLERHSEINGDIIFEDGQGKVYVRGDSKISGQVIGGNIINK